MAGKNYGVYRRRPDYLRRVRKPITITGVARRAVLNLTSRVFLNRAVYRRRYDYYLVRVIMPITITGPPVAVVGAYLIQEGPGGSGPYLVQL